MSEWQPIETAPKDGTHVLLIIGETIPDLPDIRVGSWCTKSDANDLGYPTNGWLIWNEAQDYFVQHHDLVTHWMPLPEPPK